MASSHTKRSVPARTSQFPIDLATVAQNQTGERGKRLGVVLSFGSGDVVQTADRQAPTRLCQHRLERHFEIAIFDRLTIAVECRHRRLLPEQRRQIRRAARRRDDRISYRIGEAQFAVALGDLQHAGDRTGRQFVHLDTGDVPADRRDVFNEFDEIVPKRPR